MRAARAALSLSPPLLLWLAAAAAAAAAVADTTAPPPPPEPALLTLEPNRDNFIQVEGGGQLELAYANGEFLSLKCGADTSLDLLPRAALRTRVRNLTVAGCAPPARPGGYLAALRRLGVALLAPAALTLHLPPAGAALQPAHLEGLAGSLAALSLAGGRGAPPSAPAARLLAPLRALHRLEARGVPLAEDALAEPPPALEALTLVDAGAVRVGRAALASLTALVASAEVRLEAETPAPRLRVLSLRLAAGAAPPPLALLPRLETLSLTRWSARAAAAWESCAALTTLTLTLPGFEALPARWLASCAALQTLEVQSARHLTTLPPELLEGECGEGRGEGGQGEGRQGEGEGAAGRMCPALALTRLTLRYSALRALPERLFEPVPNLEYLDLKHNKLLTLPNSIFAPLTALTKLILAENDFRSDVYDKLSSLRRLRTLDLAGNRRLGDACAGGPHLHSEESKLERLTELEELSLSRTAVSRICRDWRLRMTRLSRLRMDSTNVTRLWYSDLQYVRTPETAARGARVVLLDTPVRSLLYSAEDELRARTAPPSPSPPPVLLELNLPLRCDCETFRAARALRARPAHAALAGALLCGPEGGAEGGGGPRPFATAPLADMVCAAPAWCARLPAACACAAREQGAAGAAPARLVRVRCERAGLRAAPGLAAPPGGRVEWDLRLAGNDITELDVLPEGLTALDVRDSGVRRVSAGAAAALPALERLRLAGNPLDCGCAAAPLLAAVAALRARAPHALDDARCADGRRLAAAAEGRAACWAPERGGRGLGALAALLGTLCLLALGAAALGAMLARPERRARLKGALLRWGWLPRAAAPEDARPYDVFVSFAHEDAAAARSLAARLEAGPAPLRLCLHSRDWAPGEYIDAQIAASVRSARRTLALVSRAWLRSRWARVELREALAAAEEAPRLVLVLLEEARVLAPLDRELRRCMARCTYLQRDHPHFWERLREALPRPQPPPQPQPPPPAPAPAPAPEKPAAAA